MDRAVSSDCVDHRTEPIPAALNIVLFVAAAGASVALLWKASLAESWLGLLLAAVGFSFVNNTMFALLHEAVHGQFHPKPWLNDYFGRFAALFFPTSYSMQRVFHLGHHQRNRSAVEQFDYFHPGDNKVFKYAQWYSILTGLYWAFVPVGCLVYLLLPGLLRVRCLRAKDSALAQQSSADAMFSDLEKASSRWIRAEILFALGSHVGLFFVLNLNLVGWASCYAAFALNWSALQYADHAWSVLDVREGAWNLRVNKIVQYCFLNYHHHLAHHRQPEVPWLYLPRYVDFAGERPCFWSVYLSMWGGPRPFPPSGETRCRGAEPAARPWRAELTCLAMNLRFTRRHPRYFIVFLLVYRYSLLRWRSTRAVRFGYCLAQHVDDILDGDFAVAGEPLEIVDALIRQFETDRFDASAVGNLARCARNELTALRRDGEDPAAELMQLFRVMRFDRERVREGLLLSAAALAEQHWQTFYHSVNLLLIVARAELRAADVSELVRAFGWCSTLRDLEEDIGRGLINIPAAVIESARRQGARSLTYAELMATTAVRQWIQEFHAQGMRHLERFDEQLAGLGGRSGVRIMRLFGKSMKGFHGRYIKDHPELFTDCVFMAAAPTALTPYSQPVSGKVKRG